MAVKLITSLAASILMASFMQQGQPIENERPVHSIPKESAVQMTPEESEKMNYGKYDIPPTLKAVLELDQELQKQNISVYDGLGFYPSTEDFRYFNTPSDVIPFGNIGVDGIHFGFLTDFGSVTDLENAPIVCVQPMDFDQPTRIIANNLREFLRINMTDQELFYNYFADEQDYLAQKQKWESEYHPSPEELIKEQTVEKLLMEKVSLPAVEAPFQYVQNVRTDREKKIVVNTQDKLGVVNSYPHDQGKTHAVFPVHKDKEIDLEQLKLYFQTATYASKLALFRDVQMNFILEDEEELRDLIVVEMVKMGLKDEARRIEPKKKNHH